MKRRHAPESALIFDWRRHDVTGFWLWFFLAVTFAGLASLFVLFRIVTPEVPARVARPQQVILLDPSVPAERALIHRAMDRSFTLIPSDSAAPGQVPSALLPAFHPATRGFQVGLRGEDLSAPDTGTPGPLGVARLEDVLPPLPPQEPPPPRGAPAAARLRMAATGRALRRAAALEGIPLLDPERVRFRVAVDAAGRAQLALPMGASEDETLAARLHRAVMDSRFQPVEGGPGLVEWAEVTFAWEVVKSGAP